MYEFFVRGVVQGVGFRPFVYTACKAAQLVGYVQNVGEGVIIVVNDKDELIRILSQKPSLARLDFIGYKEIKGSYSDFSIKESAGSSGFSEVPPDLFLCSDCLKELRAKDDWRHNYWFISCTNCGPRFSMITGTPYDRPFTSMKHFPMCRKCSIEYSTVTDRRYHAQTIACPDCGPKLEFINKNGESLGGIEEAAEMITSGEIVAVKGVGGFHLVCSFESVGALRDVVGRVDKPFAVMVKDERMLKNLVKTSDIELELLRSSIRPIVVLRKKHVESYLDISELDSLGVMFPYTALHYLLFDHIDQPLIFTSSNKPGEPISTTVEEQFVDHILNHTREIVHPLDDSIVKVINGHPVWLRRSRGMVPKSIPIDSKKSILALGAEMNSTFCLTKNGRALVSQYFGNLSSIDVQDRFLEELESWKTLFDIHPELIVCDEHPTYDSTSIAHKLKVELGVPLKKVQHHRAHIEAVAAEHGLTDYVGIAMDGLGYGLENCLWGGEVFDGEKRIGHLQAQLQLGGDMATKKPSMMLCSILLSFMDPEDIVPIMRGKLTRLECDVLHKEYEARSNALWTTSVGRVLDAAAVLLTDVHERTYDGRPAMILESLAGDAEPYQLKPLIEQTHEHKVLNTTNLFQYIINHLDQDKARLAATVHRYIAEGLFLIASGVNGKAIVFGGGVVANRHITSYLLDKGVKIPKELPAGDGGISFGQVVAYSRM